MNVELMVLTMNMEARLTMVEDGDGVAEVMNVVTRRGHQPTLAPPPALSISIHRMLPSSSSRAQLCLWSRVGGGGEDHRVGRRGY